MTIRRMSTVPRRIHDLLQSSAAAALAAGSRIADASTEPLSYDGFGEAVGACASFLRERGVGAGDRVAIISENCCLSAAMLLACSRLDAWAVPLNARLSPGETASITDHCGPRCMIFASAVSSQARSHAQRYRAEPCAVPDLGAFDAWAGEGGAPEESVHGREQVAVLIYTSGTTGAPKGVMLTHGNLCHVAIATGRARELCAADRVYGVLPLSHAYGLGSTFLGALAAGASIDLVPRFEAKDVVAALAGGISVFQGVPQMFARLVDLAVRSSGSLSAPKLRYLSAGGAPLDGEWKRRIEQLFGHPLNNGYGLTEAAPTLTQTSNRRRRADTSVGWPIDGVELRIVATNEQQRRDLPAGEVGEIWARGPGIMKGYYRDPPATRAVLDKDGWLNTGDLGWRDEEGALFLAGRCREVIIRSGFNVYPLEVEAALNAHPQIVQSAVVGRKAADNEEVVAYIEPVCGAALDEAELRRFLAERLAPYKRPSHIVAMASLPASSTGKIRKRDLVADAAGLAGEAGSAASTRSAT